ncbi:MAG: Uma2 family endonuclease [Gemmataceae bacterium]
MTTAAAPRPATAPAPPLTSDDLLRMGDAGKGYELVRGKLKELNVRTESSRVGGKVFSRLDRHCDDHRAGWAFPPETGFRCFAADPTDPDRVRKPDAAFISFATLPRARYKRDGFCETVPDVVAEVVSPNDTVREVDNKRLEWLRAGVKEVWVLNPDTSSIHVYQGAGRLALLSESDTLTTPILPGFAVAVADLFRVPDEPPQAPAAGGE